MRGGKREGAGRKPAEPTTTIRIPSALLKQIKKLIEDYKAKK